MAESVSASSPEHPPYRDDPSQPNAPAAEPEAPIPAPTSPTPTSVSAINRAIDRQIRHLTLASVSLALTSLILGMAFTILARLGDDHRIYVRWQLRNLEGWLISVVIITVLISGLNAYRLRHERPLPLAWNLFFDGVIAILGSYSGVASLAALADDVGDGCGSFYYDRRCKPLKLAMDIVGIVTTGFIVLLGILHLILFALRGRQAYLTKGWRNSKLLRSLPTGQITLELSLKLYKKPEATVGQQIETRDPEQATRV